MKMWLEDASLTSGSCYIGCKEILVDRKISISSMKSLRVPGSVGGGDVDVNCPAALAYNHFPFSFVYCCPILCALCICVTIPSVIRATILDISMKYF